MRNTGAAATVVGVETMLATLDPGAVAPNVLLRRASLALQELAPGANRTDGSNALGTHDDLIAVRQFLAEYTGAPATLRTYTKEVERLLLWAALVRRRPLSGLARADFAAFAAFLADPQPAQVWCGPRRGRAGRRLEAGWRPFVGPLQPAAQHAALVVVGALMNYLVRAGYLRHNPLALMRRQSVHTGRQAFAALDVQSRTLDDVQWAALRASLAPLQPRNAPPIASPEAARERFLVAVLYFLALRVGEVARHTMGHFCLLQNRPFFAVTGKGNKPALVPVNAAMAAELDGFRAALGRSSWPLPNEPTALVPQLNAPGVPLGERRINPLLKTLLARAAARLPDDPRRAEHMRRASAHWFRHTSLTRQAAAGISLAELRENARHSKLDTTMLYVHPERDARHESMQAHGWGAN